MKTLSLFLLILLVLLAAGFIPQTCPARDFIVEFEHENYKEEIRSFSYTPILYHAIQVRSDAGPKLLILTGDNYHYRAWLRQYIARGRAFVARVPDDQDDLFVSSRAFEIDVTRLHPIDLKEFRKGRTPNKKSRSKPTAGRELIGSR